jgi:acyl-coenzyme A synthetase/AMP-(fatty) acid ligase
MGWLPLNQLFQGGRDPERTVALDGPAGGARTWGAFTAAAAGVADQARRQGGQRWLLACAEAWDFAAGAFGLLLAGRTVVVPPNFLPGTLQALAQEADGVMGRAEAGPAGPPPDTRVDGQVEFWTSGSAGEPKRIVKALAQLDAEVAMLERTFGALLGAAPVVGTVPHHHIYGCLFRILWPLAAGRPFQCAPCGDPAGFRRSLGLAPVLVASPAHLSRLPRLLDLDGLVPRPVAIFSSGGPLDAGDARIWRRWAPAGVQEIYGSTETGGIAWRSQDDRPDSTLWTPCDDVTVAFEDGALVVTSFRAGPGPLRLEDAAEPTPDGRFRLLGRLDRTLKLEEKRISLPELERTLEALPWVARAAVVLLQASRPTPGAEGGLPQASRPMLGAVVVLRPADAPGAAGAPVDRAARVRVLRAQLAQRFEAPALPRRWRFPQELPYDERGKLTPQALAGLFRS